VAIYHLPENGAGEENQSLELHVGEHIQVVGTELVSTGALWKAQASTEMVKVLAPQREEAEIGKTNVTFDVQAMQTGGSTVTFSMVTPQNTVLKTWKIVLTVT